MRSKNSRSTLSAVEAARLPGKRGSSEHPAVTGALVDGERHVANAQAWMAALFEISEGPPKS